MFDNTFPCVLFNLARGICQGIKLGWGIWASDLFLGVFPINKNRVVWSLGLASVVSGRGGNTKTFTASRAGNFTFKKQLALSIAGLCRCLQMKLKPTAEFSILKTEIHKRLTEIISCSKNEDSS